MKTIRSILLSSFLLSVVHQGKTAQFYDGAFDFNALTSNASLQFTNDITISLWFYRKDVSANLAQGLFAKGRRLTTPPAHYCLGLNGAKARFWYANPNGTLHTWETTSGFKQTNIWNHIAVSYTWGTAASIKMYLNGESIGGSWVEGTGAELALFNSLNLNVASGGDASTLFNGIITEPAFWKSILTAAQIKLLANRVKYMPLQISRTNLVAYWPKDDGIDSVNNPSIAFLVDRSGNVQNNFVSVGKGYRESVLSYQPNE